MTTTGFARIHWAYGFYDDHAQLPGWIRIEERPGARLVAHLHDREDDARAIVDAHNKSV